MLDPDGFIAEGSGDNFFIVKDREVISPEGRNILRGVSRDYVKELCGQLNLNYKEKNFDQAGTMHHVQETTEQREGWPVYQNELALQSSPRRVLMC